MAAVARLPCGERREAHGLREGAALGIVAPRDPGGRRGRVRSRRRPRRDSGGSSRGPPARRGAPRGTRRAGPRGRRRARPRARRAMRATRGLPAKRGPIGRRGDGAREELALEADVQDAGAKSDAGAEGREDEGGRARQRLAERRARAGRALGERAERVERRGAREKRETDERAPRRQKARRPRRRAGASSRFPSHAATPGHQASESRGGRRGRAAAPESRPRVTTRIGAPKSCASSGSAVTTRAAAPQRHASRIRRRTAAAEARSRPRVGWTATRTPGEARELAREDEPSAGSRRRASPPGRRERTPGRRGRQPLLGVSAHRAPVEEDRGPEGRGARDSPRGTAPRRGLPRAGRRARRRPPRRETRAGRPRPAAARRRARPSREWLQSRDRARDRVGAVPVDREEDEQLAGGEGEERFFLLGRACDCSGAKSVSARLADGVVRGAARRVLRRVHVGAPRSR